MLHRTIKLHYFYFRFAVDISHDIGLQMSPNFVSSRGSSLPLWQTKCKAHLQAPTTYNLSAV